MKFFKIILTLTTILFVVNGMERGGRGQRRRRGEASTSTQQGGEITQKVQTELHPIQIFELINQSMEEVEREVCRGSLTIEKSDENKITYFVALNNDNLSNEFIQEFFKQLFEARKYYKKDIINCFIKQQKILEKKPSKKLLLRCLNRLSVKEDKDEKITYEPNKVAENIEIYKNSQIFEIDTKIFNTLPVLSKYNKQYAIQLHSNYNQEVLEKSVSLCEDEGKNAISELKRNLALNRAISALCSFKSYTQEKKKIIEEKYWIGHKGTWTTQGERSKHEKEMYATNWENEVDDDSNVFDFSILDIEINFDIPPIVNFSDVDLDPWLLSNIKLCKFNRPTAVQAYAISVLTRTSNDLLAVSNTGSGKTVAFLVPLIDFLLKVGKIGQLIQQPYSPNALIIAPTRELAEQIYGEALKLTYRTPIVPALVHGGTDNYDAQIIKLKAGSDIIVATPMRLINMMKAKHISLEYCNFVVLDEVDRLLDNNFREQIFQIINETPKGRRTVMFSATESRDVFNNSYNVLKSKYINLKITQKLPTDIIEELVWVGEFKKDEMLVQKLGEIVQKEDYKVVIFLNQKKKIDQLVPELNKEGYECLAFHKDLGNKERKENFTKFKKGEARILVASEGFGRGIDDRKITHIINYDAPESYKNYVHRVGRAGRMGDEGTAITFINNATPIILKIYNSFTERTKNFTENLDKIIYPKEFYDKVKVLLEAKLQRENAEIEQGN